MGTLQTGAGLRNGGEFGSDSHPLRTVWLCVLGAAPGSLFFPCDGCAQSCEPGLEGPEGTRGEENVSPWICGSGAGREGAGLGTRLWWVRMGTAPSAVPGLASSSVMHKSTQERGLAYRAG